MRTRKVLCAKCAKGKSAGYKYRLDFTEAFTCSSCWTILIWPASVWAVTTSK